MLRLTSLSAGYTPSASVLTDITFGVEAGVAVGLIGRNGAGKTCLARTVHGLLRAHAGTVELDGRSLDGLSPRQRVRAGLALVPEGRLVFADLTVRENLEMAAYGAGRPLDDAALERVFAMFPTLHRKSDHHAGAMSGGEQQWLALGRALVQAPRVIVLDEPSLGLSPVAIAGLAQSLSEIRDSGVAIVLMEQNPHLLEVLCQRVLLLDRGRVVSELDMAGSGAGLIARAYLGNG
ncbi:MAG: ABC transporter ATP-binding protein [Nocardioides sp.]|uniref:ABC transporter ATP-binding protein n=1 Tax=Nocardioides sp. TaxID=35761 RepID=UPI0039E53005